MKRREADFNSIKVRLEPLVLFLQIPSYLDFNSIKVRLELTAELTAFEFIEFQFHKGTIRTMRCSR